MLRDVYRRIIDPDAFMSDIFRRAIDVLRRINHGEIDEVTAGAEMLALHSQALKHPPAPREIPPLPGGHVGVEEVMALLRRVIRGKSRVIVSSPWSAVLHTNGDFVIDGWRLAGFRRNHGIKYLSEAIAPDGRRGTYDSWDAREGNPVHLLSNDDQDALDDLMEAAVPRE